MSRVVRSHWVFGTLLTLVLGVTARVLPGPAVVGTMTLSLTDVNPDLEQIRPDCLTLPAGPGAIQCDDFVYSYSFLTNLRLNRPYPLSLSYNSKFVHLAPLLTSAMKSRARATLLESSGVTISR